MNYVFLGGTVANNHWRNYVISELQSRGIRFEQIFNPVVEHWTKEIQEREEIAKNDPNCLLVFVLSSPDPTNIEEQKFTAAYSLYEAISCVFDKQERTIVFFDHDANFDKRTRKGLKKIEEELQQRHPKAKIVQSYNQLIDSIIWKIYR